MNGLLLLIAANAPLASTTKCEYVCHYGDAKFTNCEDFPDFKKQKTAECLKLKKEIEKANDESSKCSYVCQNGEAKFENCENDAYKAFKEKSLEECSKMKRRIQNMENSNKRCTYKCQNGEAAFTNCENEAFKEFKEKGMEECSKMKQNAKCSYVCQNGEAKFENCENDAYKAFKEKSIAECSKMKQRIENKQCTYKCQNGEAAFTNCENEAFKEFKEKRLEECSKTKRETQKPTNNSKTSPCSPNGKNPKGLLCKDGSNGAGGDWKACGGNANRMACPIKETSNPITCMNMSCAKTEDDCSEKGGVKYGSEPCPFVGTPARWVSSTLGTPSFVSEKQCQFDDGD